MSRLPVKPLPWAVTYAVFCGRGLVRSGNQWFCFALKKACGFISADGSNNKGVPVLLVTPAKSSHVLRTKNPQVSWCCRRQMNNARQIL